MLDYAQWLQQPPYSLARDEKRALMMQRLQWLTEHHRANCAPYRAMLDGLGVDVAALSAPEDVPFLPVSLFKTLTLASMPPDEDRQRLYRRGAFADAYHRRAVGTERSHHVFRARRGHSGLFYLRGRSRLRA